MPIYTSKCSVCNKSQDYFRKIDDRADTPECCGKKTAKSLDTPMVSAMIWTGWKGVHMPDGKNGGQGTWIEDGAQYKKYIKQNNYLVGDEGQQEASIQRRNIEARQDKKLEQDVIKAVQIHS